MKIMTLGYSTVGKTYFLGSLFKLSFESGQKGFSVQHRKFHELGQFEDIYDVITTNKNGYVASSVGLRTADMILKRGVETVINLHVTDVEGQALQPSRSQETALQIIEQVADYDGLIFILIAPSTPGEVAQSKQQLAQMFSFAEKVLVKNKGIPVALILNQIDRLRGAKGLKSKIESAREGLKSQLIQQHSDNRAVIRQALRARAGEVVNNLVKSAIDIDEIDDVIDQFFVWVRNSRSPIPNKIFLCTSLGFDNSKANVSDSTMFVSEQVGNIMPYGSAAAFLWTIYARLKTQKSGIAEITDPNSLSRDLLEDIQELYTSGKAYFDNSTPIWSLRNVSNLQSHNL